MQIDAYFIFTLTLSLVSLILDRDLQLKEKTKHQSLLHLGSSLLPQNLLNIRILILPNIINIIKLTPSSQMCIPQYLLIQIQYPLNLPHGIGVGIIKYRDEATLLVVAIAVNIGIFGLKAMGELSYPVVLDGAHYAPVLYYFERYFFHCGC